MGWASAGQIFDPVAQALVDADAPDETITTVCAALIRQLMEGDWDTLDESIGVFGDQPAVMAAFAKEAPDWMPDDYEPAALHPAAEAAAWRLLLDGAESHVEDALDEAGDYEDGEFDAIRDRAMALIKELRKEHDAGR
jgi:hypothetical protein